MSTEADKVNTGALATLVAVGTFAVIGIAAAVTALVRHDVESAEVEKRGDADRPLRALRDEQAAKLNQKPKWIDAAKGVVRLPIDRAKEVVVADLQRDPNTATAVPPGKDAGVDAAPPSEQTPAPEGADAGAAEGPTGARPETAPPIEHALEKTGQGLPGDRKPAPVSGGTFTEPGGSAPAPKPESPPSPAPKPESPPSPAPTPPNE